MMDLDEAKAFCKTAVEQEVLNTEQVESFTSQVRGGIESPGAYFMLHAILKKDQVERVNKALKGRGSGVTQLLMREEDTVFHLPPAKSKEEQAASTGEDTKVLDISESEPEAETKDPESGIIDIDGILVELRIRWRDEFFPCKLCLHGIVNSLVAGGTRGIGCRRRRC